MTQLKQCDTVLQAIQHRCHMTIWIVEILCICPNRFRKRSGPSVRTIEDPFVVIHPDLSQADQVAKDDSTAIWKGVGALFTENVPNNRTWNDFQKAPTLPDLWCGKHTAHQAEAGNNS